MGLVEMNREMRRFLKVLSDRESPVPVRAIGIGCTVYQGIARQEARCLGYAVFEAGCWSIMGPGRLALQSLVDRQAA